MKENKPILAIIGLGYVGLPLAVAFAKKYSVIGFDINQDRIDELSEGHDSTLEVSDDELKEVLNSSTDEKGFFATSSKQDIAKASIYIVTVPTPVDKFKRPVLTPLIKSSEVIGEFLKKDDLVIYESTVYPGVTEEVCVPILAEKSGLTFNEDFFAGYSPERINPGDKKHTVTKILKVTSGSTPAIAEKVDQLYASVIEAGTHKASSIKVAEAAKVIENSQRDINIAFVNELSKIFRNLDIDTTDVIEAAATKWNFIKFTPGLVGGHCIGVDPYYLAQKAEETGYNPEIILAGRRMNDGMGRYVAQEVIKLMVKKDIKIKDSKALVLGITFKENCPDTRNTRVIDVIEELKTYGINVTVADPWANVEEVKNLFGLDLVSDIQDLKESFDSVVLAVSHNEFLTLDFNTLQKKNSVLFDVKSILPKEIVDGRL
ncbi:nucleotide sugar dehydrogenase [Gangjinia marincola]|uniref:Nucleotide sugar dehydrogenase n=1 Tax=Gangjinia marincola TaxID=578463 RepID=A0ABN1MEI4_9FLAO